MAGKKGKQYHHDLARYGKAYAKRAQERAAKKYPGPGGKRKEIEDFGHIGSAERDVIRMERKGKIRPEDSISKQYYIDLAKHGKAYAKRAYEKAYHKKHDVKYSAPRTPPPPAGVKPRKYNKD